MPSNRRAPLKLDVSLFRYQRDLGASLHPFVVIKGFHQADIVKRIKWRRGDRSHGLTAFANADDRRYGTGQIVRLSLAKSKWTAADLISADWSITCKEPFAIAFKRNAVAYSTGSQVVVNTAESGFFTLAAPWLSFIHTVEFSSRGRRILVCGAGFDTVVECDLDRREVTWEWNGWDHGFNKSATTDMFFTRKAKQARLLSKQHGSNRVVFVADPTDYPVEGIPTRLAPLRLSGASYGNLNTILLTAYHGHDLLIVSRNGKFKQRPLKLKHAHSFRMTGITPNELYSAVDSGNGRFLTFDNHLNVVREFSFLSLPCDKRKRKYFGEWLQTAAIVRWNDSELLIVVDALRQGIHVLDIARRLRRFIRYPSEWSVQSAVFPPALFDMKLLPAGPAQ